MRARCNCAGVLVLVMLAALHSGVTAQQRPDRTRVWAAVGLGGATITSAEGMALMAQLVYQKQPHHIALRGLILADPYDAGSDAFGDLALLYGRLKCSQRELRCGARLRKSSLTNVRGVGSM